MQTEVQPELYWASKGVWCFTLLCCMLVCTAPMLLWHLVLGASMLARLTKSDVIIYWSHQQEGWPIFADAQSVFIPMSACCLDPAHARSLWKRSPAL